MEAEELSFWDPDCGGRDLGWMLFDLTEIADDSLIKTLGSGPEEWAYVVVRNVLFLETWNAG